MIAELLVALAIAASPAFQPDPNSPRQNAVETVDCSACGGQGILELACWLCEGDGSHPCRACTGFAPVLPRRAHEQWIPLSYVQAVMKFIEDSIGELPKLDFKFPGAKRTRPRKPVTLRPGELKCPAGCSRGKLQHGGRSVDCKVCRAGKFRCDHCKRGEVDCGHCAESGRAWERCVDCLGSGRLPDPRTLAFGTCPWCLDQAVRPCGTCAPGPGPPTCADCFGAGARPCGTCRGIGLVPCETCGGRGRYGIPRTRCTHCGEKGRWNCPDCEDGLQTCKHPEPGGGEPPPCVDCAGQLEHACNGCGLGAYLAWERAAAWRLERGDSDAAVSWLEEASRRSRTRYDLILDRCRATDDAELRDALVLAVEEEQEAELARLQRAMEAARVLPAGEAEGAGEAGEDGDGVGGR